MQVKVALFLILLIIVLSFGVNPVAGKEKASDFTLIDIDGNSFTLSKCPAKIVLLDFFGTQCSPCKAEIPTLRSLYHQYSRDDLEIISISPEDESTLRNFAQEQSMEWIVAGDLTGSVSDDYDVSYIPRTFLVDVDRYISYDHVGWSGEGDASELQSKISSLLSGTGNGDYETTQSGPPYALVAIGVGVVIVFLIIGIVAAGHLLGWSKPSKKRRSHKRKH